MAFILKDRVKENTTSTGTSSVTLGGASATFETFQQYLTNGDTTFYAIVHNTSGVDEWEVGLGSWNTGNTLSRTTVLSGSNGTSAVNFSAGNKDVFMTLPADKLLHLDANGDVDINGGTIDSTVIGAAQAAASNFTTVDATGNVSVGGQLDVADWIDLASQASHPAHGEGRLWYDNIHKTLNYYSDDAGVVHEIGIEEHARVYNETGSTLSKGTPIHFAGTKTSNGTHVPTVAAANATSSTKYKSEGMVAADIANNSYGYIITAGRLEGIDTSHLSIGQFFTGITDGATQTAVPVYPNFPMCLGFVVRSDATNGVVFLAQQNHSIKSFRVQADQHIGGSLTIDGDLNVTGSTNTTSTSDVTAGAPFYRANEGDAIGSANTTFTGSGLDDAFFAGHFTGTTSTTYYVKIDGVGTPDTFAVSTDNFSTTISTGNAITGSEQMIHSADNISVKFGATTGHTLNDVWTGTASPINVDTGFFSNRNTGTSGVGYTHMGLFYDASESKWRLVDEYDPVPAGTIDTAHSSYVAGTIAANVEGNVTGNITGNVAGNAATASALESARTIGGVSFDGTANINLAGVNTTGNQDTTGNAATATALENARTIQVSGDVTGSASFDGTANINITTTVQDDSHAHLISNVDGLQTALDAKVPTSRTITAGNGLTGGGDLSANRTLTVGGGSGITVNANDIAIDSSYTGFDGRYYTETEADSRYVNRTGDTMNGTLSVQNLTVISNTVGTTSDIALTANAAINAENSMSFGMTAGASGYYRWLFGNTSKTGGTAGGTEKMRLNKDGNLTLSGTVDGVDIAARDGVLTTTTNTANAALPKAGGTMTGDLTINEDGDSINLRSTTNGVKVGISFSSDVPDVQIGHIRFAHSDSASYGSAALFELGSTEPTTTILADGKLMYNEGIYAKPASGTGAGTRKDANWDTAYTTANAALPKAGGTMTGTLTGRDIQPAAGYHLRRLNHHSGHLEGSYNNIAANADKTNPIYSIGSSYNPNDATLNNFYGIGFSKNTASFMTGALDAGNNSGWGLYVAADGDARIFLNGSHGIINSTGEHYVNSQRVFHDGYHPNADTLTTARTINGVSFNGSANITVADSTKLPLSGGTMTGELQLNARLDVGDGSNANHEIRIYKADNNVSDHIQFYNGTTRIGEIGCEDTTWLRINQETAKNIYTPRYIRADGGFFVDSTAKGIDGSGNFIGGTITGASDANVSNWNTAYTTANAALPKAGGTMTGDLTIPAKIIHSGDTDTYFEFHGANVARMVLAGAEVQEWGANYTLFSDDDTVRLGSSSDFRMWFNGTDTFFRNYAHAGGDINFQGEDTEGTNHALIYMHCDTSRPYVRLFENGSERLRTLSGGVGVTGLTVGDVDASPHNAGGLQVSNTNNEKIVLSGSTGPYIRWQEATTDKAYIQWNTSGFLDFRNQETGVFKFQSTVNGQSSDIILMRNDTATTAGEDLGSINFGHTDGNIDYPTQSLTQLPARIVAEATETAGDGDDGARLMFFVKATNADKATTSLEALRLDQNRAATFYNDLYIPDQIIHSGDTNTYMQFHAADQWRVVAGGSERLEVKNSSPHVLVNGDLNSTSDERLKKNIKPIDNALADICQLEGVTFDWRDTGTQGQGFIAQQVEPIIPEVVNTDEDTGMKSVNYVGLIGHLVEAIKTQQTQIDDLKAEIQSMKS